MKMDKATIYYSHKAAGTKHFVEHQTNTNMETDKELIIREPKEHEATSS